MDSNKKIKRVDDLPEWFNLEKYAGLQDFGLKEWASALGTREGLECAVGVGDSGIQDRIAALLARPLSTWGWGGHPGMTEDTGNLAFGAVHSLSVQDASFIVNEWPGLDSETKAAKAAADHCAEAPEQAALIARPFDLATGRDIDAESGFPSCVVDLAAPDDLILASFRRWLSAARETYQFPAPERVVTKDVLQSWIDLKILPYFDLHLWSTLSGNPIPLHILGEALFPNDPDGNLAERVRRTVRKKCREVVNYHMATSLRLQATIK